jgi:hypothetical protein
MRPDLGLLLPAAMALAACAAHAPAHHGADACATWHQLTVGKSADERRAVAGAQVRERHESADPAHVERHLRMMDQRCGAPDARAPRDR